MGRPLLCKPEWVPLLGTEADRVLAEKWGVSCSAVKLWRDRHAIAAWGHIVSYRKGDPPGTNGREPLQCPDHIVASLGTVTDRIVAEACEVSVPVVFRWRSERGIPPFRKYTVRKTDTPHAADPLLGKASDRSVAKQVGMSPEWVSQRRKRLGVPAYTVSHPKQTPARLLARVEALEAENARLREELEEARANEYKGGCPEAAMTFSNRDMANLRS